MKTLSRIWQLKNCELSFTDGPAVMGIVNVTPDSFSDGGQHATTDSAIAHGIRLASQGAAILDIGGESTRPYSDPVGLEEELKRVIPVIEGLANAVDVPISIDTSKSAVAAAAIEAGAQIINDVTGLEGDPDMVAIAASTGAGVCAMHAQGSPQTMQDDPQYENVTEEILDYLMQRQASLIAAGIPIEKICLDPGIGFGKTHAHNLQLVREVERFHQTGSPILIGHSRKGFIKKLLGDKELGDNQENAIDAETLRISLLLATKGIQVLRVHEVQNTVNALKGLQDVGEGSYREETDST